MDAKKVLRHYENHILNLAGCITYLVGNCTVDDVCKIYRDLPGEVRIELDNYLRAFAPGCVWQNDGSPPPLSKIEELRNRLGIAHFSE